MSTLHSRRASGFTLIELMIAIVLLAVLISIAMPSFRAWMMNIQVRNVGSSITAGLQRARAEALTRNTTVVFTLGSDTSWSVNLLTSTGTQIDSRLATEGSQNVTLDSGATVTFSNLGLATLATGGTDTVINITATGATQSMRVIIKPGGSAKLCDPSLASGASAC